MKEIAIYIYKYMLPNFMAQINKELKLISKMFVNCL